MSDYKLIEKKVYSNYATTWYC